MMKMSALKNIFAGLVGGTLLAACTITDDIATTQNMPAQASSFHKALHAEYVGLAKKESGKWDTLDARYFNEKAKMAAQGKSVGPQAIDDRSGASAVSELVSARKALVAALEATGTRKAPQDAARAQAMFDCWMEEQEEGYCPKDIASCRNAFYDALKRVEAALGKPAPVAMAKPKPAPLPPVPGPYIVYFDFDKSEVDSKGWSTIIEASEKAKAAKIKRIFLNGHADRSGANAYNMALSKARVAAVANALDNIGFSLDMIKISFLGEESPAVSTPDGKREAKNRRVEIKFER